MPHLSIILTAVDEKYRQRGIHQIMNKHFEHQARSKNCVAIRATVNLNNHVRFKTAEKDNLSPLMYIMSKKIK
jgi:ribosomal protein S18 acetylase RimI-like enzyme